MEKFDEIVKEVKEIFTNARKSHDWEHTERVYNMCMHIGNVEGANLDVLKFAAILHDIGREEQDKSHGKVCHAERGAELAEKILMKHNVDGQIINKVKHCIETHRSRGKKIPQSLEAKVLYDSDKLDSIGAIGIGRAFVFAGEVGAKVHNKSVDVKNTKPYTEEDTAYREFLAVLCKIKGRMLTKEGKRIAEGRHKFMVGFFERLNVEVDGEL